MKYTNLEVGVWLVAYIALGLAPMAIAFIGPTPQERNYLVELGVSWRRIYTERFQIV